MVHNRKQKASRFHYFNYFKDKITTSVIYNVFLFVTLLVPVMLIIEGATNLDECPLNPLIPIWFIVGGSVMALNNIANIVINVFKMIQKKRNGGKTPRTNPLVSVLGLIPGALFLGWVIGATVLGFEKRPFVRYERRTGGRLYCSKKLFDIMYIQTIAIWSIFGLILLISFVLIMYGSMRVMIEEDREDDAEVNEKA